MWSCASSRNGGTHLAGDYKPDAVKFYSESKVVLGYIHNVSKLFFVYMHNRVHRLRQTTPQQWHYVPTDKNPAVSVVLPRQSHVTRLLVNYYHSKSNTKGKVTEKTLRSADFWIVVGKHPITSVLHHGGT